MPGPPMRRSRPSWWTSIDGSASVASATGSGGVGSGTGSGPGSGSGTGSGVGSGTGSGVGSGTGSGRGVSSPAPSTAARPPFEVTVTLTSSGATDSSVDRKRSARGPSRMLARFLFRAMGENLLGQLAVGARGLAVGVVLDDRAAANGRLGELDRLADPRLEDQVAEVLLEDLDGLLGVDGPRVEHRRQDPLDLDAGVEVLPDHLKGVLKLDQAAHGEVLALDRDDDLVRGGEGVDGQQPEARRRVDADEVVVVLDRVERLLQGALTADLGAHRDLGAGQIDRGDGDVDLALHDDLADRDVVDEHVEHAHLDLVGVDPLTHGEVALRVHVHGEDAMAGLLEGDREVEGGGGLGHPALLVRERDHLGGALVLGLLRVALRRFGGLGPTGTLLGLGRGGLSLHSRVRGRLLGSRRGLLALRARSDQIVGAHPATLGRGLDRILVLENSHRLRLFRTRRRVSFLWLEQSFARA